MAQIKIDNQLDIEVSAIRGNSKYRMRVIITRGLYTFYPFFGVQKRFFKVFFLKVPALCMVSIQERFPIKSGL